MDIIAMSGGVDSSVALLLSKEMTGDVRGVTLSLTDPADEGAISDARAVCERMQVQHDVVRASEQFRERVIDYFIREYLDGRTPNPCVMCNREIKFGLLAGYADSNGYGRIITGHYAGIEKIGEYSYIRRAKDTSKDQSYMLAFLDQSQIRRAAFPLGGYTKAEIREMAEEHGFVNARKKDSQDVCFIPDGDYVKKITELTGKIPSAGMYTDTEGNILGPNRGYWCYTIGQRKGLGIALGRHAFVLSKDAGTNTVVLGDEEDLMKKKVRIDSFHIPGDGGIYKGRVRCMAKIRYAHRMAKAVFERTSENGGVLEFDEPQRAPAPGQFAVLYDESGEYVIGAGTIE